LEKQGLAITQKRCIIRLPSKLAFLLALFQWQKQQSIIIQEVKMKKRNAFLIILFCLASALFAQSMNEGFEGTFPPTGWTFSSLVTQSSTYAYAGSYSGRFEPDQTMTTTSKVANPGTISFYARMSAQGAGRIRARYSTDGTNWTTIDNTTNIVSTFNSYSFTGITQTNVFIRLIAYNFNAGDYLYLDNVSISPAGPLRYRSRQNGNWSSATTWQVSSDGTNWFNATQSPTSSEGTIEVVSGHTVTVTADVSTDQTTVNGSLTVNSGITLTIANGTDTNDIVINGTLTNTGTVAYAASALMNAGTSSTIIFNGSAAQTTGTGFPATVNNLTLNNSYSGSPDLTLSNNLTVNGTFTVTQGTLSLNGKTLSYGTSASLLYNGSAPQTSGSEWLSSMTRPVTISNTSASGVIMDGNRGSTSSITVTTGATLTMSTYVISGTGSFTLGGGATFVTANTNGVDGSITTGSYSFSTTGNYTFNGSSAQITGLNFPATVNNFTVENSAGVTWSGNITVNGNLNVNQGFFEMDDQYFQIPNNSIPIAAFVVVTSTPSLFPEYINRQWSINGTWSTGSVSCRFYWDEVDDNNYDWTGEGHIPSVYKGSTEYTATSYSLSGSKRWVDISIPDTDDLSKGTYIIGRADEGTLPVELSSFTVALSAFNQVTLQWVTQSETNVSGFRVYRNVADDATTAELLNMFVPATNTSQLQVYMVTDEEVYEDGVYYYWLENVDLDGSSAMHGPISITVSLADNSTPSIPVFQGIQAAFPNPFNPRLTITLGMKQEGLAEVAVFNLRGQKLKTLFSGRKDKGNFSLQWDGTDETGSKLPSGIYLVRMNSDNGESLRKVVLSK